MSGYLLAVLGIVGGLCAAAIGDMVSDEIRDRLDHLPHGILRLAARRLDAAERAATYDDVWLPELTYILRGDEARPVTRMYHGTRFALGILVAARRIARNLRQEFPGRLQGYSEILPPWHEAYRRLEAAATLIREFELQFVPALLQTEDYARAVIRMSNPSRKEAIRRAEARISRQDILQRVCPPRLWVVIDEGALRRVVGGRDVMREQLRHLIEVCDRPGVTVQILPRFAGAHQNVGDRVTIYRFPEADWGDVAYAEHLASALYTDRRTEVEGYLGMFDTISSEALLPSMTRIVLAKYLADL